MATTIRALLEGDHARLDALLARAAADPDRIDEEAFAEFRAGLLKHIGMEEKILFPAAKKARGGAAIEHAERLRKDHGELAALLVRRPTRATLERLRAILDPHNALEEGPNGVYAACTEALAGEEPEIVQALSRAPEVPVAPYYEGPIGKR